MTRRFRILMIAGALLACVGVASMFMPVRPVAQETCAARCLETFAACYKRTQNRTQCEQLREACIKQCKRP